MNAKHAKSLSRRLHIVSYCRAARAIVAVGIAIALARYPRGAAQNAEPGPGAEAFAVDGAIPQGPCERLDYHQPARPQFHFTACQGWLNDPNGMVFDGRQFHLFFQHNPLAPIWGNMTWGHATSTDMIRWTQQPHALRPYRVDGRSGTIYSGTAVVDHNNSLGVQQDEQKTLCAFFTFAAHPKFYQAMAYSTDGGATWTYWNDGRPVVDNQGFDPEERDPKVFWHEPSKRWVMALWVHTNPGRVRFFTSDDLVRWSHASDLLRDWAFECMDLAFVPVNGDVRNRKAVLYDASFDYEVGTFDGREFHTESGPHVAGGGNFYAAQTFNNNRDGRVVQIGWMRGGPNPAEKYGVRYNQQMSFPCELTLRTEGADVRLCAWPIAEIDSLVRTSHDWNDVTLPAGKNLLAATPPLDLVDAIIEFAPGAAEAVSFQLAGASLRYDALSKQLIVRAVNDQGEPVDAAALEGVEPRDGVVELRVLIDRTSIEAYAFQGRQFHVRYRAPPGKPASPSIIASGGDIQIKRLAIRELQSAWRQNAAPPRAAAVP